MSEAQLIGRGARYFPFQLNGEQPLFARKFDDDPGHELRIGEELYYHSAYNPEYIRELDAAMREFGIKPAVTEEHKAGRAMRPDNPVCLHKGAGHGRVNAGGLDSDVLDRIYRIALRTGQTHTRAALDFNENLAFLGADASVVTQAMTCKLASFGQAIVRKATQRIAFYEFARLRTVLPNLKSINELIVSEKYLGAIRLEISGLPEQLGNLTADQKLQAATEVLISVAGLLSSKN